MSRPGLRSFKAKPASLLFVVLAASAFGTFLRIQNGGRIRLWSAAALNRATAASASATNSTTPLERHLLATYRSMVTFRSSGPNKTDLAQPQLRNRPKFLLLRLPTHGFGNRIRSLNGAVFLAALTDRILLLDMPVITALFDPPMVDGVVIDWHPDIADGVCRSGSGGDVQMLSADPNEINAFRNFADRYRNATCLILSATHGHDRQLAALNPEPYRDKVRLLFGHPTSRYVWSYQCLRYALQRPRAGVISALQAAMHRVGLDAVPWERRIAVQVRGWHDSRATWRFGITCKSDDIWSCIGKLIEGRAAELGGDSNKLTVLFVSDSPKFNRDAVSRLGNVSSAVERVILPNNPVVHTDKVRNSKNSNGTSIDVSPFLDWLLIGEASAAIVAGYSSFGTTAFFRPASASTMGILSIDDFVTNKRLYTFGVENRNKWMSSWNPQCGRIKSDNYDDITFGIMDPEQAEFLKG